MSLHRDSMQNKNNKIFIKSTLTHTDKILMNVEWVMEFFLLIVHQK